MRKLWIGSLIAVVLIAAGARAQSCPPDGGQERGRGEAPKSSTLRGQLVYHDELRQWLGVKLEKPICGAVDEVQLVFEDDDRWRKVQAYNGCHVTALGKLFEPATGYYSAELAMMEPELVPDVSCKPAKVKPDPAKAPRKASLTQYFAQIVVDYRGKGHVDVNVWEDAQRKNELAPWQAYVHYMLTGAQDVMWFGCNDGFHAANVSQTPKAKHEPDEEESLGIATVLDDETVNTVAFQCVPAPPEKPDEKPNEKKAS